MLGISINDWVIIVHEIVWEFETVVINIPRRVWLLIILAVGVNILARNYPKSVNLPEYTKELVPIIKVENVNLDKATLPEGIEGEVIP